MNNKVNIFACLVHESRECVIHLVRNLHCLDPDSVILLYNGERVEVVLLRKIVVVRQGK